MSDLNVPEFKSLDDFSNWVTSLDEKEIQKWTTDDWLAMYNQVDKYVASENFTAEYKKRVPELIQSGQLKNKTVEECLNNANNPTYKKRIFTEINANNFGKMYRNYCFEPEQLQSIRKMATENGEKLAKAGGVDAAKLAMESSGYENGALYSRSDEIWTTTNNAGRITQQSTNYGSTFETGYVHTKVKIDNEIGQSWGVAYSHVPGEGTIHMAPKNLKDESISVAFHESAHAHYQGQNQAQRAAIQEGRIAVPELGEKFQALMMRNGQYYLSPESAEFKLREINQFVSPEEWKSINLRAYNGYHKQPMEKYSQYYGIEAERAYRRASGQLSERTAIKVADYIAGGNGSETTTQIGRPANVKYSEEGIELVYESNKNLSVEELERQIKGRFAGADESLLKDMNITIKGGEVKVTVPTSYEFSSKWDNYTVPKPLGNLTPEDGAIKWDDEAIKWDDSTSKPKPLGELTPGDESYIDYEDRATKAAEEARKKAAEQAEKMKTRIDAHPFATPESQPLTSVDNNTFLASQQAQAKFNDKVDKHMPPTPEVANTAKKAVVRTATPAADKPALKRSLKNQAENAGSMLLRANATYDKWVDDLVSGVMKWDAPLGLKNVALAVDKASGKVVNNKVTRATAQQLEKKAAAFAKTKAGQKIAKKLAATAAKLGGEAAVKSLAKKIPLLSLAVGLYFGGERLLKGQFVKAAGEVLSGAAGCLPVYGTAASLSIDGAMLADDLKEAGIDMSSKEAIALLGETLGGGQFNAKHNPYASESTHVVNPYVQQHEIANKALENYKNHTEVRKAAERDASKEAAVAMENIRKLAPWRNGGR